MNSLELHQQWTGYDFGAPEVRSTMAQFRIIVDGINLAGNENTWSQSVQDHILVSTYPLADWMLQSWWRLLYEPIPHGNKPDIAWRMSHELGSAGHGFVWPKILFVSDGENVHIWASPSTGAAGQSVRYLNGLPTPASIPLTEFERTLTDFVSTVVERLETVRVPDTHLSALFSLVVDEGRDDKTRLYRKLEALLGFDPDESPPHVMERAINMCSRYGEETLFELAPVYGARSGREPLETVEEFANLRGITGYPSFNTGREQYDVSTSRAPWTLAVHDAHRLRSEIGITSDPIDNATLADLLGMPPTEVDSGEVTPSIDVSVGIPIAEKKIKYLPRKRHPISRRFELARYIADFIYVGADRWLANTDVGTARQKYQRAFAAEFLCPINALVGFLNDDYSEEAIIDAADRFSVSERTIESLLVNNGYQIRDFLGITPLPLGFQAQRDTASDYGLAGREQE
ncbi:hypothetical protein JXA80_08430 [bacterium]|nr:hypothetical protein [candidate division CSSED10-310 bacterium]